MNEREARYGDKMNFVVEKIESIPKGNFNEDIIRDASFYKIQVGIEGVMDRAAMLVRDSGRDVGDDYHNLELLKDEGIISGDMCGKLKKLNGLRNILIHRYNRIEEDVVFDNLNDIRKVIFNFIKIIEDAIKSRNVK